MSSLFPDLTIAENNDLTHTDHLQVIKTCLGQAINDNTKTIDDLQTRLARVRSHFEASLPQTRLQTNRLSVMAQDLSAISEAVTRLSRESIEGGEEEEMARLMNKVKENIITTTATPTRTQLPAPPAISRTSPLVSHPLFTSPKPPKPPKPQAPRTPGPQETESSPYTFNPSPSPFALRNTPTTIDKLRKPDRTKTLLEKLQLHQSQSMSIPEPAQDKPAPTTTTQEGTPTSVQNGGQIPPLLTPNRKSPGHSTTTTDSAPPRATPDRSTKADQVKKPQRARTSNKAPQGPLRRSMRITESVQKGGPAVKPTTESNSPILKPKARAGITKRTTESVSIPIADMIKSSPQIEGNKEPEGHNQDTTMTATDKPTKARRTKTPGKLPQAPQRRSTRIMESAQKVQDKPATIKSESPILKQKSGAGVSKRGGRGGARGGKGRGGKARGG